VRDPLADYYAERAPEYESIYDRPERQADLARLAGIVATTFANRRILEVACGTGYWTELLAMTATHVTAVDVTEATLELARAKPIAAQRVRFQQADAYALNSVEGDFDAGAAMFWWSHVPRQRLQEFLRGFHSKLQPGSIVAFIDNQFVEGNSTPIARTDDEGNTFQKRKIENGNTFEVLKNYPSDTELQAVLSDVCFLDIIRLHYYWCAIYRLPQAP
jgi:demethylmenaquinone methyltransferase/2-methoxy-6-polyprenyl-1,4-benzoquinol methylase